jgi:hypothetical protein
MPTGDLGYLPPKRMKVPKQLLSLLQRYTKSHYSEGPGQPIERRDNEYWTYDIPGDLDERNPPK